MSSTIMEIAYTVHSTCTHTFMVVGIFLNGQTSILSVWAEVGALKIVRLHKGSICGQKALKFLQNDICVLVKPCWKIQVSQTMFKPIF